MVEAVAHSVMTATATRSERASVIPAASAVHAPAVSAAVDGPEVGTSEVEVVAVGVACVDAEVPVASLPVEWTVEVGGSQIGLVLPVEEDIAQVEVTLSPVGAIEVGLGIHAHQVVEVHLIGGLILLLGKVELIGHLVGEEQCLLACLLITHGIGCHGHCDEHCQCDKQSSHSCMFLLLYIHCLILTMQNCEEK